MSKNVIHSEIKSYINNQEINILEEENENIKKDSTDFSLLKDKIIALQSKLKILSQRNINKNNNSSILFSPSNFSKKDRDEMFLIQQKIEKCNCEQNELLGMENELRNKNHKMIELNEQLKNKLIHDKKRNSDLDTELNDFKKNMNRITITICEIELNKKENESQTTFLNNDINELKDIFNKKKEIRKSFEIRIRERKKEISIIQNVNNNINTKVR